MNYIFLMGTNQFINQAVGTGLQGFPVPAHGFILNIRGEKVPKKLIFKIIIDILMLMTMPFLMAYMLVGEKLHEWLGTGIFILFILHHVLNFRWIKNLFRNKYTVSRITKTLVDILILLMIIGLAYSGVILSRYVFNSLSFNRNYSLARELYMFCSYWGFTLMSLHFGFHWDMFQEIAKKFIKNKFIDIIFRIIAIAVAGYGIYAFRKREIGSYLLMKMHFAFFDVNEPLYMVLLDYIAIMGLFSIIGYYIMKVLKTIGKKRRSVKK